MWRKQTPRGFIHRMDAKPELEAALKVPPEKSVTVGLIDPVRLEPVHDVAVTGDRDKLPILPSDGLLQRMTRHLRHLAVDHRGKLVHHDEVAFLGQRTG